MVKDPATSDDAWGLWRDGEYLVCLTSRYQFPDRCVRCGQPARRKLDCNIRPRLTWKMIRRRSAFELFVFPSFALIWLEKLLSPSATVRLGLCKEHHARELWARRNVWLLCLVAILSLIGGFLQYEERWMLSVFLLFFGLVAITSAPLLSLSRERPLIALKVDRHFVWLEGAEPRLLVGLPAAEKPEISSKQVLEVHRDSG